MSKDTSAAPSTMARWLCLLAGATLASAFTPSKEPNMNGHYDITKTPKAPGGATWTDSGDFKDYPKGVEYFDAYHGPINSTYGMVYWTHTSNPLPADIVTRFKGKVMAIVGMESDQVRKDDYIHLNVLNNSYNRMCL